jgi:trk system potassium uptake protein TrkA
MPGTEAIKQNKSNIVIMGCGRVGGKLAAMFDAAGYKVTVVDLDAYSFRRLPPTFSGTALIGDGTDEDMLRKAGIENANAFIALTQGDNRNVMAAQIAKHIFEVPRVICRIYDPLRKDIYEQLGLESISPTEVFADLLFQRLSQKI